MKDKKKPEKMKGADDQNKKVRSKQKNGTNKRRPTRAGMQTLGQNKKMEPEGPGREQAA